MVDRYLVKTDHGDVLVRINTSSENALEADLLSFEKPTPENLAGVSMEVPLRAFTAKMVEIIQMIGVGNVSAGPKMVDMMIQEKATSDLNRIERWARDNLQRVYTIDHFEESWAVIEAPQGGVFSLPRALLPKEAKEGDVLRLETAYGEGLSVTIVRLDRDETRARLEASRRLLERLRGKDPGGDLEL